MLKFNISTPAGPASWVKLRNHMEHNEAKNTLSAQATIELTGKQMKAIILQVLNHPDYANQTISNVKILTALGALEAFTPHAHMSEDGTYFISASTVCSRDGQTPRLVKVFYKKEGVMHEYDMPEDVIGNGSTIILSLVASSWNFKKKSGISFFLKSVYLVALQKYAVDDFKNALQDHEDSII